MTRQNLSNRRNLVVLFCYVCVISLFYYVGGIYVVDMEIETQDRGFEFAVGTKVEV